MGIRSIAVGLGGLVVAAAAVVVPLASASSQAEPTGLWSTSFRAQQVEADCGKWKLDANGFCVADDARNGLEAGVRFRTSREVSITGLRLYRADTGNLRGTLWDSNGTPLATGVFPGRSSNGWQDMSFDAPVRVVPGRTYVASYFTPRTKYAFRYGYFADAALTVGPITALKSTTDEPNGVYCYDDAPCVSFPVRGYQSSTYWVTPLWGSSTSTPTAGPSATPTSTSTPKPTPTATPTGGPTAGARLRVLSRSPAPGAKRVPVTAKVRVTFSSAVRKASLTRSSVKLVRKGGARVPARLTYDAKKHQVVLSPRAALRHRTTYRVLISTGVRAGNGDLLDQDSVKSGLQAASWVFRTR
jgi:Domain of unknown function (DUF4082)/Bacterial Ig-like domain